MSFKRHILRWALLLPIAVVAFIVLQFQHAGMLLDYRDHVQRRGLLVPYAEVGTRMDRYLLYAGFESRDGPHPHFSVSRLYPGVGSQHIRLKEYGLLMLDDWSRVRLTAMTFENQHEIHQWNSLIDAIQALEEIAEFEMDAVLLKPDLRRALGKVNLRYFTYSIDSRDELFDYGDQLWIDLPSAEIVRINRSSLFPSKLSSLLAFYGDKINFYISPETELLFLLAIHSRGVTVNYQPKHDADQLKCYVFTRIVTAPFTLRAINTEVMTTLREPGEILHVKHQSKEGVYTLFEKEYEDYQLQIEAFRPPTVPQTMPQD